MSNHEITDSRTVIKAVAVPDADRRGAHEAFQVTKVYQVKPPFNPGRAFMNRVMNSYLRGPNTGRPELGRIATPDSSAAYLVYRNTDEDNEALKGHSANFDSVLEDTLPTVSNEDDGGEAVLPAFHIVSEAGVDMDELADIAASNAVNGERPRISQRF